MERLTHQGEHGPYWDKTVFDKHGGMEEDLIIDRLAYYEDMEAQGRLVVLPCKVGDTVYFRTFAKNATVDLGIQPHKVITYRLSMVTEGEYAGTALPEYEFGRSVFLSREEAEQALKGGAE